MSHAPSHNPKEHGTVETYVVGFVLSLIFTLVPYFLVQSNKGAGRNLLLGILALAVVQLIIQIVYFLHLGRGPKQRWELYFFISTVGIILIVVGGSLIIINNLHSNMSITDQEKLMINEEAISQIGGKLTGACQITHVNHVISITGGPAKPIHTSADKCDTLTFRNDGKESYSITFGSYPQHESYAGVTDFDLRPGKTKTITLSDSGAYMFHDRQLPYVDGSFTVFDDQPY